MASALKNLSDYDDKTIPNGEKFHVGIVVSDWNKEITHKLYEGCFDTLIKHGVKEENIETLQVPGTFELPSAASMMMKCKTLNAVICIGCVIKGETDHDKYINQAVSSGLSNLGMATGIPVIFGVLTPNTEKQAKDRAGGKYGNKGVEAAVTALRMSDLKTQLTKQKHKIGF